MNNETECKTSAGVRLDRLTVIATQLRRVWISDGYKNISGNRLWEFLPDIAKMQFLDATSCDDSVANLVLLPVYRQKLSLSAFSSKNKMNEWMNEW